MTCSKMFFLINYSLTYKEYNLIISNESITSENMCQLSFNNISDNCIAIEGMFTRVFLYQKSFPNITQYFLLLELSSN